ncbi:MAG TPA: hypothetical protein VGD77_17125, partial [Gemmatimonadaceae bacterium]
AAKGAAVAKVAKQQTTPPRDFFRVRQLDPRAKCGPGTSVEWLVRVDERLKDGRVEAHLVFFDRHGWYCEHGASCHAVAPAKRHVREVAGGGPAAPR